MAEHKSDAIYQAHTTMEQSLTVEPQCDLYTAMMMHAQAEAAIAQAEAMEKIERHLYGIMDALAIIANQPAGINPNP